jgi:hypothetical protein
MKNPTNKAEAIACFQDLVRRYGLRWTARTPVDAYDAMEACNQFLSEDDRRNAIFHPHITP